MQQDNQRFDIFERVTTTIISLLEKGTVPWRKPWVDTGMPMNLLTRHAYTGINHIMLNTLPYEEPYYVTFRQVKAVAASVIKGERGHLVVFRKTILEPDKQDETKKIKRHVWRYYFVFNIAQCTGIPSTLLPNPARVRTKKDPIQECEWVIEDYKSCPAIKHESTHPYYDPTNDYINMPPLELFNSAEGYYDTLFHELVHSTGHESRLARKELMESDDFGGELYSMEELVAEIGACYLNSFCGIGTRNMDNNVAYIQNWLKILRNDKRFIVYASARAQKAVDYILNIDRSAQNPETSPAENMGGE